MRAKKINEDVSNVLVGKTSDEISKVIADQIKILILCMN